jgi:hypothetical protein
MSYFGFLGLLLNYLAFKLLTLIVSDEDYFRNTTLDMYIFIKIILFAVLDL